MCLTSTKGVSTQIAGGESCPAAQDGFHILTLPSLPPTSISSVTYLTCSCRMECSVAFNGPATVGQLALPYWMAKAMGERGRMTLRDLQLFCETYRQDMSSLNVRYPIPGYDS